MIIAVEPHREGFAIYTAYYTRGKADSLLKTITRDNLAAFLELDSLDVSYGVQAIEKVLIFSDSGEWKLRSPFRENAAAYQRSIVKNFEFFYHPRLSIKTQNELRFTRFADEMRRWLDLPPIWPIRAYVAPNLRQLMMLLGIYHHRFRSSAFAIPENTEIYLSHGAIWHEHELAHILFREFSQTSHNILVEGVATYVGGGNPNNPTYESMLFHARNDLAKHDTTFTLNDVVHDFWRQDYRTIYYATGAWLCARVVERRGLNGLKSLLSDSKSLASMKEALRFHLIEDWERTMEEWRNTFY
jgi:hypothetical protein